MDLLEDQVQDLSRKINGGNYRGGATENKDEKISGVERRIDAIERQLSSLASNFEAFMRRFEGHAPAQQQTHSRAGLWERTDSTKDLKTPETVL